MFALGRPLPQSRLLHRVGNLVLASTTTAKLTSSGATAVLLLATTTTTSIVTRCEGNDKPNLFDTLFPKNDAGEIQWTRAVTRLNEKDFWDDVGKATGHKFQTAIDSGIPTQLSYGFVSGYCSGLALKKVGKAAATIFGVGFITLQTLAYHGYIVVDHVKLQQDVQGYLDFNADGAVDGADRAMATQRLMEVLQFNLPAGGGFTAGFVGGLRSG